jgi:hypothetical protein
VSRTLPAGIWALGFVSMLMDISSELIHSLLPVFMALLANDIRMSTKHFSPSLHVTLKVTPFRGRPLTSASQRGIEFGCIHNKIKLLKPGAWRQRFGLGNWHAF